MEGEQTGETQKALLTPFLTKTYQMVDDPAVDDLISWNEDGSGFIIWRPAEFARDLLPKYFKHNNLSSFVRQLNTYGFRKVVPDRWEFANDFFKKGEKGLLHDIHRRKMTQSGPTSSGVQDVAAPAVTLAVEGPSAVQSSGEEQKFASTLSPGGTSQRQVTDSAAPESVEESQREGKGVRQETKSTSPELKEENERLEKENRRMTEELIHLKGLCNNIFSMMSGYSGPSGQQDQGNMSMESKRRDLLQSGKLLEEQGGSSGGGEGAMDDKEDEENLSPRLFGVSIGAKRRKTNEHDVSGQRRQQQQDEGQAESYNASNTAQSERRQKPGPS